MLVRDSANSRSVLLIDEATARDDSGKVVALRSGSVQETVRLTEIAAREMSGRAVLMDLGPADVVTPATQAEFGIPAGDYVADIVSPVRFITHDRGVFYVESALDSIQVVLPLNGGPGGPAEINPQYASTSFVASPYALMTKIPRHVAANADFDVKRRSVIRLVEALKLGREQRVATQLLTSGNWASSNVVAATAKWDAGTLADPLADLFAALGKSVLPANVLVMAESVSPFFFANTGTGNTNRVRDFVQAGGVLPKVAVAKQKLQSGGAVSYVWAPGAPTTAAGAVLVRDPGDPDRIPTACTFRWLGDGGVRLGAKANDGEQRDGMLVRSFFDHETDSHIVVVAHNDFEAMPAKTVGALITGAYA